MKKTRALSTMQRIGNSLGLEDAVVDLAHRYFCYCRDAKEKLNRENTCIVQCLVLVCSFLLVTMIMCRHYRECERKMLM